MKLNIIFAVIGILLSIISIIIPTPIPIPEIVEPIKPYLQNPKGIGIGILLSVIAFMIFVVIQRIFIKNSDLTYISLSASKRTIKNTIEKNKNAIIKKWDYNFIYIIRP